MLVMKYDVPLMTPRQKKTIFLSLRHTPLLLSDGNDTFVVFLNLLSMQLPSLKWLISNAFHMHNSPPLTNQMKSNYWQLSLFAILIGSSSKNILGLQQCGITLFKIMHSNDLFFY